MFAVVFAEATGSRRLSGKGKSAAACKYQIKRDERLASSLRFSLWKVQMSPARFQQGWRIRVSKKQQQHLPVDAGGTALTDSPSHSGCWTYGTLCTHPKFSFWLRVAQVSGKQAMFPRIPTQISYRNGGKNHLLKSQTHKYYTLLLSRRNSL